LNSPAKIRVLVVDDSVVVRRMLTSMLSTDPAIEVIGAAPNGKIALARIPQYNPDCVILDVEMPELDGLQTLAELRKSWRTLPVIMFSTVTERGAAQTLDALTLGASDYVTKPSTNGGAAGQISKVIDDLINKIKVHCGRPRETHAPARTVVGAPSIHTVPLPKVATPESNVEPTQAADVVAIGISTGGPNALAVLMPSFPANLSVPVLIVQHMPRLFTKLLAERLSEKASVPITEAKPGEYLEPGHAYIAPGDYHMTIKRAGTRVVIETNQDPHENSCRPSADVMFRSVARVYGSSALGVVMTGMGQDGLRGCEAIRGAGGRVLVQDEASSVVWGMPGFVARSGLAHAQIALGELGSAITLRVRKGTAVGSNRIAKSAGVAL